ncbi:hypothetical protein [Segetibacter koreensis]|uniref:hypothetical protein n=1 Tax=Segetibacter koreensis TaxID=398037 RepID=UPI000361B82C|nr:hypothetical protein [Segetibacter koreensis]
MQHFKQFIIKLQTIDIKINQRNGVGYSDIKPEKIYDISHENPFLSSSFANEMKELRELALTDILMLQREQIVFQMRRLGDIKDNFRRFWENYNNSYVSPLDTYSTDFFWRLRLHEIFIAPHSTYQDHAVANNNLVNDLEDTITAREDILEQFEAAVLKAIDLPKEEEKKNYVKQNRELKLRPVFRKEMVAEFFEIIKNYFPEKDHEPLLQLLSTSKDVEVPLSFNGSGNQLADAFKQLYLSKIIVGCNKTELESWIQKNFQYNDKGVQKQYTEKYLQDIVSSNTKPCQSPLLEVKRIEGKYYLTV